jgi:hypothetical protein
MITILGSSLYATNNLVYYLEILRKAGLKPDTEKAPLLFMISCA